MSDGDEAKDPKGTRTNTAGGDRADPRFGSLSSVLAARTPAPADGSTADAGERPAVSDEKASVAVSQPHLAVVPQPLESYLPIVEPSARDARPGTPARAVEHAGTVNLGYYLPSELRARLRRFARNTDRSQVAVVLDAIEATHERLPGILADRHAAVNSHIGLFRRSERGDGTGGGPTVNMRVPGDTLATIDRLWHEADAHSRSEYLRAALETYLGPEGDKPQSRDR